MIVILLASFCVFAFGQEWGYESPNNPETWPNSYSQCGGTNQSPIDINCKNLIFKRLSCINFSNYSIELPELEIVNLDGKTIELLTGNQIIVISGGNLNGSYVLEQFHFHWGRNNNEGSEHTIRGYSYPLEIHFVHRNKKYPNMTVALQYPDGVVVVGVFQKICRESSSGMEIITNNIANVLYPNDTATFSYGESLSDLLPEHTCSYYQYKGSLTTPPCTEGITWIILKKEGCITQSQLEKFRQVRRSPRGEPEEFLTRNFRPTQPLNGRKVLSKKPC